jgi:hypothetical protein
MYDRPTTYSQACTQEAQDEMVRELQWLEMLNPAIH